MMHRLLAEQLRCATDANGQVDLAKLDEFVSAAYEPDLIERYLELIGVRVENAVAPR